MKINLYRTLGKTCDLLFSNHHNWQNMADNKCEDYEAYVTSPSCQDSCVPAKIVVFSKKFWCFEKYIFLIFSYILYLHMYLHYTYFLHDAYTTLTCTTYNTYITIQLH